MVPKKLLEQTSATNKSDSFKRESINPDPKSYTLNLSILSRGLVRRCKTAAMLEAMALKRIKNANYGPNNPKEKCKVKCWSQ